MGSKGSILVYNRPFENTIHTQVKDDFPGLKNQVEVIQSRMIDLMTPFRKNYRLPEMNRSYSIKYVLPALVPEMRYDELTIANGSDASTAFYNLQFEHEEGKGTKHAMLYWSIANWIPWRWYKSWKKLKLVVQ